MIGSEGGELVLDVENNEDHQDQCNGKEESSEKLSDDVSIQYG
jgi:hypothetical protein